MYQPEDLILYGSSGVCRVEHIGPIDQHLSKTDSDRLYYTLSPLYGSGYIYAPVDSAVFMRPIIDADEVNELIDQIGTLEQAPPSAMTPKALADRYHTALQSHSCQELLSLLAELDFKRKEGKKLGQIEQRYQKQAEALLFGEFSSALGIPLDEIPSYIQKRRQEAVS